MSILVTGSGGQLGSEWVDYLKQRDIKFTACNSNELDITDSDLVKKELNRIQPDIIVNCAAYTNVDNAESEIDKAFKLNKEGVEHLTNWCMENHAGLIHYSTDYVFPGRKEDIDRYPLGYPEDAETDPVNSYGKSKRAGEEVLLNSGVDFLLIRVSWLCGRYGNNFVKTMLKLGMEKDQIKVVNDQVGSPSFTGSVVLHSMDLLERECKGIFHISSGGMTSWYDFAKEVFNSTGMDTVVEPITTDEFPTKAPRPAFSKLNCSKVTRFLGTEMVDWKRGLHDLIKK
jgi:dTDP-4-dehydrorhamnose reductase